MTANSSKGITSQTLHALAWTSTIGVLVASVVAWPQGGTFWMAGMAIWALRGPYYCIQALVLSTLLSYLNPALSPLTADAGIAARIVLIVAAMRVLPMFSMRDAATLWPLWFFSLIAAVLSAYTSSSVSISMMKILTFATATTTAFVAFSRLPDTDVRRIQQWFGLVASLLVLTAVASLPVPRIAFYRNGTGLQGIINHPQALAAALAPFAAWQVAGLLVMRSGLQWIRLVLLSLTFAVLVMTESRTGMVAAIVGTAIGYVARVLRGRTVDAVASAGRVLAMTAASVMMLAIAVMTSTHVYDAALKFAFKRAESNDVAGAFNESRGNGIQLQWRNFIDQPWTGHGFGVYAQGDPASSVTEVFGIPISAPVEKGFAFTAVLEETGIVGGVLFFFALARLGYEVWRAHDLRWIALFASCIAVNAGESIILAPGGIGLIDWLLIALAVASARLTTAAEPHATLISAPLNQFPNLMRP